MNTFSKKFSISSYDLNPSGQARLTTMANFFQEMAYHHASLLGLGYNDMMARSTIWVLSRMRINMKRYPVWDESIELETWPSGAEKLFALRDFRVRDSTGEEIGRATTAWLILDSETHRLIRPKEVLDQFKMIIHDEQVFEKALDKIALPDGEGELSEHRVLFSDLDIIGHVNNVKYMEWCIDSKVTPADAEKEIREFEINFNHETKFGERIRIAAYDDSASEHFFTGTREGDEQEIFRARMLRV